MKPHPLNSANPGLTAGISYGFTHAKLNKKKNELYITHNGNMGNRISDVNKNLYNMGIPTIEYLKMVFDVVKEDGSPDYSYGITFKIS